MRFRSSSKNLIAEERPLSHFYGGRSVFGWAQPPSSQTLPDRKRLRDRKTRNSTPERALGQ